MDEAKFLKPVIVNIPGRGARLITSAFDALDCLEIEWPEKSRGHDWQKAKSVCRDCLDGWKSSRDARRSVVKAAANAGLLSSRWSGRAGQIHSWLLGQSARTVNAAQ